MLSKTKEKRFGERFEIATLFMDEIINLKYT
jgi:hypothetical protein